MFNRILNLYRKRSVQAKASLWFIVCSILQKAISTITIPLFTRMMSQQEYGTYTLYLSWLNIFTIFTSLQLYYEVFSSALVKMKTEQEKRRYIASMQGLSCILCIIIFIVFQIFHEFFEQQLGLSYIIIVLMFAELLVAPSIQYWMTYNKFKFKYKSIVIVTILKSLLNPLLGLLLVSFSQQKDVARILSVVIVEVAICGWFMCRQFYQGRCFFDKKNWKYALCFGAPLIPHYLSATILHQSDRIMIDNMVGKEQLAIYGLGGSIGGLMLIFTTAFNSSLSPTIFLGIKNHDCREASKTQNILLIILATIVLMFSLLAPEAAVIFGGHKYDEAKYVIVPIIASVYFKFLYNSFANIEFYFEKKGFILLTTVIVAVVNIALNYFFISWFGYIAAAYTTLFSDFLFSFGHCVFSILIWKKERKEGYPFNLRLIWGLGAFVVAGSILISLLYPFVYVRYSLAAVTLILMIIFRKKLIELLKNTLKKKTANKE